MFLQSRAAVAADGAVDLDGAFVALVLRELGSREADRVAGNFQDVAGFGADAHQIGRSETRNGVTDVFHARFGDAERHRARQRGRERF